MSVTVKGLAEVDANLKKIGQVAGQKAMRSALYAASKPILDQAKINVPKRSGALQLALTRFYKVGTAENTGSRFTVSVGPKAKNRTAIALYNLSYKRRKKVRGIFYGHLQEFEHKDRGGGSVPAKPFLLPALRDRFSQSIQILADQLRKKIEKALVK